MPDVSRMTVELTSFAYRQGLPHEVNFVFDVRFLADPHHREDLRANTGKDMDVAAYIEKDPALEPFFTTLSDMLLGLLPNYGQETGGYLRVAIGCAGGRHRSVYVIERLSEMLRKSGHTVFVHHRDLKDEDSH